MIYRGKCKVKPDLISICPTCEYCITPPSTYSLISGDHTETVNIDGACKRSSGCRIVQGMFYEIVNIGEQYVVLEDSKERKLFRVPIESVYNVKMREEEI